MAVLYSIWRAMGARTSSKSTSSAKAIMSSTVRLLRLSGGWAASSEKGLVEQHFAVFLDAHDVCVAADDLDEGRVPACENTHLNVEWAAQRRFAHRDLRRGKVLVQQRQLVLRHIRQHL